MGIIHGGVYGRGRRLDTTTARGLDLDFGYVDLQRFAAVPQGGSGADSEKILLSLI